MITATRIVYAPRITPGDHWRWCASCGKPQPTQHGKFIVHQKPNAKPDDPNCPNSGVRVDKVESVG